MSRRPNKNRNSTPSKASSAAAFASTSSSLSPFSPFSSSSSTLSYLREPPDLTTISSATLVVSIKNLLKKDPTTKTKALEDLVAHAASPSPTLDDGLLDAWANLYPRTAIDNARRVRELSHTLTCRLLSAAGKRMERRLPRLVPVWLAGSFDRDRGVARAASDGLASFLTTPEKANALWARCQKTILEYASEAIQETPDSLSDERSTSKDDADAKYFRVVAGSLALVMNLMVKLESEEMDKCREAYDAFFEETKVWGCVSMADAPVRRLACQLVSVCLEKRGDATKSDLGRLSKVFIVDGLKSNQTGSAADFVRTLGDLTSAHPTIWTTDYQGSKKSRTPPYSRLKSLVEKGSQGSHVSFWSLLNRLTGALPKGVLPEDLDGALSFMTSLRTGIARRDEPRVNVVAAWWCYLELAELLLVVIQKSSGEQAMFIRESFFPLMEQFLYPSVEKSMWTSGARLETVIQGYRLTTASDVAQDTEKAWTRLQEEFGDRMKVSLPEASKDHAQSQKEIGDEAERWFTVVGRLSTGEEDERKKAIPVKPSLQLLTNAVELLESRNWKPFGAAMAIRSAFKQAPALFYADRETGLDFLHPFIKTVQGNMELILTSSSAPYILASIVALGEIPSCRKEFENLWQTSMDTVTASSDQVALKTLISSRPTAAIAKQDAALQSSISRMCVASVSTNTDLVEAVVRFDVLSGNAAAQMVEELAANLNTDKESGKEVLRALILIAQRKSELLSKDGAIYVGLMANLLSLSEREGEAGDEVATLRALLSALAGGKLGLSGIVRENLNEAGPSSLGIDTVIEQAIEIRESLQDTEAFQAGVLDLLPDTDIWARELQLLLKQPLNPSLSITSGLGGCYFLADTWHEEKGKSRPVKYDRTGCSVPARMADYVSKLPDGFINDGDIPLSKRIDLYVLLVITIELADDQLTAASTGSVWLSPAEDDMALLLSRFHAILVALTADASGWREGSGSPNSELCHAMTQKLLDYSHELSPLGLYAAKVLARLLQSLADRYGFPTSGDSWLTESNVLKNSATTVLPAVAIITGLGEALASSKAANNFCNRLVSDLAGARLDDDQGMRIMVLLNAYHDVYGSEELPVASNRLVFGVRQITSWLDGDIDLRHSAEICRALRTLFPSVKDVYGPYWERAIDLCVNLWTNQQEQTQEKAIESLPATHASLRLISTLQALEEANDDLVDVLQSSIDTRASALLNLLKSDRPEHHSQPQDIVDNLIARHVHALPLDRVSEDDLSSLYGLLASHSPAIQTAAFTLLHRAIPKTQEQVSVDVLLEKNTAQLPDELLSLLLEPPTLEIYDDEALACFPAEIRTYLLSWHLVFDTFDSAAFKVRGDYTDHLKSGSYVTPLLEFTFDVLGHSAGIPLSLDKAQFKPDQLRHYDLAQAETESQERNMHWLLLHLFYSVLKFVPGLFKTYFVSCRSKQTRLAVETWTARHFSPLVIDEALDEVIRWSAAQKAEAEQEEDDKALMVRVSRQAREVVAGYEVDEELEASLMIKVPAAFPLEGVSVVGVNRVAVTEKKWQGWILGTQGVITFSGGSITDGLAAFRRNVVGALKGQTECAICYSVVGIDRKTPDKRCSTCRNLFHRTCLYKWFQSSGQNTCPLCRNPIEYLASSGSGRRGAGGAGDAG